MTSEARAGMAEAGVKATADAAPKRNHVDIARMLSSLELTRCYLDLANLANFALDRLSRYEATLWRQVGQVLFTLDALDRRKPDERKFRFPW